MKDKLIKLLENSYSPYSHFRVSAIVVMNKDCKIVAMNPFGETFNTTVEELCPYPFSEDDLK